MDVSEENAARATGEEKPNRFSRRSHKFTVRVIMLVYIASYVKCTRRNIAICSVNSAEEKYKFSTLCDRLFSVTAFMLNLLAVL